MVYLPVYPLPKELQQLLDNEVKDIMSDNTQVYTKIMNAWKKVKCIDVEETHYLQFLKFALYLEEHQGELDMKEYDLLNKYIVKTDTKVFRIDVDEWFEDERPLMKEKDLFDVIDTTNEKIYTLRIVKLNENSMEAVDADSRFLKNYSETKTYKIQFRYQNYPLRCNHFALWLTEDGKTLKYLFPNSLKPRNSVTYGTNLANITFCNPNIKGNFEQTQAMLNILNKSSQPYPYILYGPPGTGKTATLVETICQIVVRNPGNNVLVCTPSNTAADELTKRLLVYKPQLVFRMYSQAKDPLTIDKKILPYCNCEIKDDEKHKITVVELADILKKRIVVTTLCSSMRLTLLGLRNDHFSHVIIDEAGQSIEPDILIPFSLVSYNKNLHSQIVLAGDPKQLGPTVKSTVAKVVLGRSILERLMSYPAYEKMSNGKYNPRYITKLLLNHRNHPDIIKISNELFYNNELTTKSTAQQTAFPVRFQSVLGKEQKFQHSTSSCNFKEVSMVVKLIERIIENKQDLDIGEVCQEDIGVVTPFKLQRKEIKKELRRRNLTNINVGTVEFFQGQERKIIIISTVRTRTFSSGESRHIGFLSDPKRFNVAVTRAKSRLIVVGHPHALQTAPCWRHLLKYCSDNGSYYGEDLDLSCSDGGARSYYSLERSDIVRSSDIFKWKKFKIFALDQKDSEANIRETTKMILNLEKNTTRSIQSIAPVIPTGRSWHIPELKPILPTLSVQSASPIQKIPISISASVASIPAGRSWHFPELKPVHPAPSVRFASPIQKIPISIPASVASIPASRSWDFIPELKPIHPTPSVHSAYRIQDILILIFFLLPVIVLPFIPSR